MGRRAFFGAVLALFIAVPVIGTTPTVASADGATVALAMHSSAGVGDFYSTFFELSQGASLIESRQLSESDPDLTINSVLVPGGTYELAVEIPPRFFVVSLDCDVATTPLGDGTVQFTVPTDATTVACDVEFAALVNVHIDKFTVGADGIFIFHLDGTDGAHTTAIATHSLWGYDDIEVQPGTYAFSEEAAAGWGQTDLACTENTSTVLNPAAMVLEAGNDYVCTVENTRLVPLELGLMWIGDSQPTAQVTGSWAPDAPIGLTTGTTYGGYLPDGTWTLTPTPIDGYDPYIACTVFHDGGLYTNVDGGPSITVTIEVSDQLVCDVTQMQQPTLIINKAVDQDTTDRTFTFTNSAGVSADAVASTPSDGNGTQAALPLQVGEQVITESGPDGWNLSSVTCVDQSESSMPTTILPNGRFVIDYAYSAQIIECDVVNSGAVTVDKTGVSFLPTATPGRYEAKWDVTITNGTDTVADHLLLDDPIGLVSGSTLVDATAHDPNGDEVSGWNGIGDTILGADISVAAGQSKTWTLSVIIDIPADLGTEFLSCPEGTSGEGGVQNIVAVVQALPDDGNVTLDEDWACMDIPAADITIEKTLDGPIVDNLDGTYTQRYIVTATNEGEGYGTFTAVDHAEFGPSFVIESATFTNDEGTSTSEGWVGDAVLYDNQALGGGESISTTIDVVFSIDQGTMFPTLPDDWACSTHPETGEFVPGAGLYNDAVLTSGGSPEVTSQACADGPVTDVLVDKTMTGYEYVDNDSIVIDFDITASNDPAQGQSGIGGVYAFQEIAASVFGVQITDIELIGVDGGTEGDDYLVTAGGSGFGAQGFLAPGATHVFHVRATYVIDVYEGFNGTCFDGTIEPDTAPGGAANYVMWAQAIGGAGILIDPAKAAATKQLVLPDSGDVYLEGIHFAYDCVDLSAIWIEKEVVNDDGGTAAPDDFSFEVSTSDGDVERTVTAGDPYLLATDDYTVAEVADPNYTAGTFSCEGFDLSEPLDRGKPTAHPTTYRRLGGVPQPNNPAALPGSTEIVMQPSYGYSCDITNDDRPADLGITKSDGGATAVAGGAPITYTFVVTNHVGFLDSVATVTDTLPAGWTWVPDSVTGCAAPTLTATTFTCAVPAAALAESGDSVTIAAKAKLAADAPSGEYVNLSTVGSAGDPAPDIPECPVQVTKPSERTAPRTAPNVACDTTPAVRQAALSATKVANATAPVPVGGTVAFTLTVTNHGPSTLLSGTRMVDDLPAGLTVVSVSASGWTCTVADPVVCVLDAGIGVGATPSPIVITTRIATGASGTIVNSATFTGIVDADDIGTGAALGRRGRTEAVVVTVAAVATAVATVSVAASGRTLPRTGTELLLPLEWAGMMTALGVAGVVLTRRRQRLV